MRGLGDASLKRINIQRLTAETPNASTEASSGDGTARGAAGPALPRTGPTEIGIYAQPPPRSSMISCSAIPAFYHYCQEPR